MPDPISTYRRSEEYLRAIVHEEAFSSVSPRNRRLLTWIQQSAKLIIEG